MSPVPQRRLVWNFTYFFGNRQKIAVFFLESHFLLSSGCAKWWVWIGGMELGARPYFW